MQIEATRLLPEVMLRVEPGFDLVTEVGIRGGYEPAGGCGVTHQAIVVRIIEVVHCHQIVW